MLPLLVSTPHCSGHVPYWILARMLKTGESEAALKRRIFREGDPLTDLLFHIPEAAVTLNAPASRFVADLNRERAEPGENGVIKLTDFDRRPFYPAGYSISPEEREMRLAMYYDPYHMALGKSLGGGKIRFFIDGHSMTAQGPAIGPDQGEARPAICIGNFGDSEGEQQTVPLSCPPETARRLRDALEGILGDLIAESGFAEGVRLNRPFDGGSILEKYSAPPYSVPGVMIEVNRGLYLDEETLAPLPGRMEKLSKALGKLAALAVTDPSLNAHPR
jgi:N-formylglutamate amidohydrolase